jgi:hypothetical protein
MMAGLVSGPRSMKEDNRRPLSTNRIVRGGSWTGTADILGSAIRAGFNSQTRGNVFGFRVGRTLPTPWNLCFVVSGTLFSWMRFAIFGESTSAKQVCVLLQMLTAGCGHCSARAAAGWLHRG